jgi:hypothetical protein
MSMGITCASQGASRGTPREEPHQNEGEEHQKNNRNASWQTIKEDLISIKEGLEKEKEIGARFAQCLSEVIARVPHASCAQGPPQGVEARLDRIEALLRAPTSRTQGPPPPGTTWAKVAATGMRQAGEAHAIYPARHTVRVQMAQAKGMGNEEIAQAVDTVWRRMRTARASQARPRTSREITAIQAVEKAQEMKEWIKENQARRARACGSHVPRRRNAHGRDIQPMQSPGRASLIERWGELAWRRRWEDRIRKLPTQHSAIVWRTPWAQDPRMLYTGLSKAEATALRPACARHVARWFIRTGVMDQFRITAEVAEKNVGEYKIFPTARSGRRARDLPKYLI